MLIMLIIFWWGPRHPGNINIINIINITSVLSIFFGKNIDIINIINIFLVGIKKCLKRW